MSETSPAKQNQKTVFIVGAGASKEVRLPIGSELKQSIAAALDIRVERGYQQVQVSGDGHIYEALRLTADQNKEQNDLLPSLQGACWKIRDAMPQAISIDSFMDVHSDDKHIELCGKLAIVRKILEAEAQSPLFVDPLQPNQLINFASVQNTWFNSFFQRLTENCKQSALAERLRSVALVIFNYDRCIEHYLYNALQNYYSMSGQSSLLLLQHLRIFHPYGFVGSLPWSNQGGGIGYGANPNPAQLLNLSSQIKTFTEGTDEESSEVQDIRTLMRTTHRLIFLGFAFHPFNMDLLSPKADGISPPSGRSVLATGHGISDNDREAIRDEFEARGIFRPGFHSSGSIQISDLACHSLFHEYSRRLSFT